MKIISYLFEHYINPLIVGLLVIAIMGGASKYKTGGWFESLLNAKIEFWIIFLSLIIIWLLIIFAKRRLNKLRRDELLPSIYVHPTYGWEDIDEINYVGVIWKIQVARNPMRFDELDFIDPSDINIDTPPRCPKCKTEIEQKPNLFWGHTWKCVGCDFKKRSKSSYGQERNRVKKIAKRKIEAKYSK